MYASKQIKPIEAFDGIVELLKHTIPDNVLSHKELLDPLFKDVKDAYNKYTVQDDADYMLRDVLTDIISIIPYKNDILYNFVFKKLEPTIDFDQLAFSTYAGTLGSANGPAQDYFIEFNSRDREYNIRFKYNIANNIWRIMSSSNGTTEYCSKFNCVKEHLSDLLLAQATTRKDKNERPKD